MTYTNGFDIDAVLPALSQRLGWQQPTLAGSPVLTSPNTTSTSKRFFGQSFHAMCTINNLKANQDDPQMSDTNFNTWLSLLQSDMIMRGLNEVFREQELIEQCLMYTRFGLNDYLLPNQGQFVGWIIEVANNQQYSTQINMATFYFNQDVTFNMYLFKDGVKEPLVTIPVDVVAYEHTEVEFNVSNLGSYGDSLVLNFKTGDRYFFCYNQNELGGAQAIREMVESVATTRCFQAYNFQSNATNDGFFFNRNQRQYPSLPGGVNLEIISFRDHTQKILRKANLFDEMQGLYMGAFCLELVNNSSRTDATQRINEQKSQRTFIDLNQAFATKEMPMTPGLKSRIDREIKKLRDTFFPPERPQSGTMESENDMALDSYELNWMQQNIRVANNPGVLITDS